MSTQEQPGDVRQVVERLTSLLDAKHTKVLNQQDEIKRLREELSASQQTNREWLTANGPGGWIDEMRRKLPSPPAPSGWQPIESAPKMRKVIVTYLNALGKRRVVMGCYYLAHSLEMHDDYAEVGTYDEATGESFAPEGWYDEHDSDSPLMPLSEPPTHWMSLPPAPTQEPTS